MLPFTSLYVEPPVIYNLKFYMFVHSYSLRPISLRHTVWDRYDLAIKAYSRIGALVNSGEATWTSLSVELQEEMDEVEAMLEEAGHQGHKEAQIILEAGRASGRLGGGTRIGETD